MDHKGTTLSTRISSNKSNILKKCKEAVLENNCKVLSQIDIGNEEENNDDNSSFSLI